MNFLFQSLWTGMKWLFGAMVTPLANLRHQRGVGRVVRYTVHALSVLLVLAGLAWANYYFELDSLLRTPLPLLRYVWLPAMFALGYALLWLGWYVCRAWFSEGEASPFPEIDAAWQEASDALRQAGVDMARTPLYLLVGQPQESMNNLIRSAGISLITPPVPAAEKQPSLQVFANRQAIYVSCANVSLLGRQAQRFAAAPPLHARAERAERVKSEESFDHLAHGDIELNEIPFDSTSTEGCIATATATATSTTTAKRRALKSPPPMGLSLVEEQVAKLVAEFDTSPTADFDEQFEPTCQLDPLTVNLAAALLTNSEEVELISRRLEHVCHLIRTERAPYVPLNGIAVLIPAVAADDEAASQHVGELARRDLQSIHRMMETRCPHVALVCDLEQSPGCDTLLTRFPAEQRQRRLGVRLPEPTEHDLHTLGEAIDARLDWLCQSLLTPLAYRLVEASPEESGQQEALRGNVALYRFLFRMRQRTSRLAAILRHMAPLHPQTNGSVAGCYLLASGADSGRQQGFAEAVFAQLPQLGSNLGWAPSALATDRRQRRLARMGYAALGLTIGLLTLAMCVF